jgi:hypothetical protein
MTSVAILDTYKGTFGFVRRNIGPLARGAAVSFFLVLALNYAVLFFGGDGRAPWISFVQVALTVLIEVPVITNAIRLASLPYEQARPTLGFRFQPRDLHMLGALLLIGGPYLIMSLLTVTVLGDFVQEFQKIDPKSPPETWPKVPAAAGLVMLGMVASLIWACIAWCRLGVAIPARALGGDLGFGEAWRMTAGNGLRIFGLFALLILTAVAALWIVMTLAAALTVAIPDARVAGAISLLFLAALSLAILTVLFAALASVYRQLT